MRFWITKNNEVPVREQLVRQVLLGILSEDFPAGRKLPSVRALARRHGIHSNTVSAAYHDLLERGWLELRKGSGLYVRPLHAAADGQQETLDRLLAGLLQSARSLGHEPEDVLTRLEHMVRPSTYKQIVIVEPDPAMREILKAELAEHVGSRVDAVGVGEAVISGAIVVALPTRATAVRHGLMAGTLLVPLRLRSVHAAMEEQTRPPKDGMISIASHSAEIRYGARAMLTAAGIQADSLQEVDSGETGWQDRLKLSSMVIADVVAATGLPSGYRARVFRVIADSSVAQLKELLACDTAGK